MTASHEVTCSSKDGPDPDYRLDGIGGATGGTGGGGWYLTLDAAIKGILDGKYAFWTKVRGIRAEVEVYKHPKSGRYYLRTTADSTTENNLLKLPNCKK